MFYIDHDKHYSEHERWPECCPKCCGEPREVEHYCTYGDMRVIYECSKCGVRWMEVYEFKHYLIED